MQAILGKPTPTKTVRVPASARAADTIIISLGVYSVVLEVVMSLIDMLHNLSRGQARCQVLCAPTSLPQAYEHTRHDLKDRKPTHQASSGHAHVPARAYPTSDRMRYPDHSSPAHRRG